LGLAPIEIELKVLSQQGKEAILAILDVGDFFGEGVPCRSAAVHGDGSRSHRVLGHAPRKIGHDRSAPQKTGTRSAPVPLIFKTRRITRDLVTT